MCDESSDAIDAQILARRGLSRRDFAAVAGAGVAAAMASGPAFGAAGKLREQMVAIKTPDGLADAFLVHPAKGRHPGIVMWPDVWGLRDAFKVMARTLAAQGYAVLVVNQFYRSTKAPLFAAEGEGRTAEGRQKINPMIALLTREASLRDGAAFASWLGAHKSVDRKRGLGATGFCQGGTFALLTAVAAPERVRGVAAYHAGGLVSEAETSPHRLIAKTRAAFLFAIAKGDDAKSPNDKVALRAAADAAGRPAEIEVYGANHGWCVIDAPAYDKAEAERAFARGLAIFSQL